MDDESPGWRAIDAALERIYGEQEPRHCAPALPAALGGPDPLEGVSAYRSEFGGKAHWHYVTYGFSELHAKDSDVEEISGWGFELTLRVVDPAARGSTPPMWPIAVLQNFARYVFRTGNVFAAGHHMTLNGPIALERDTLVTAVAFAPDPELRRIDTPHGAVEFLQVVGLTQDEYAATMAWNTRSFLELLAKHDVALMTDLGRKSWLEDSALRKQVEERTAVEGSSMEMFFAPTGSFETEGKRSILVVGANVLGNLAISMRGRLALGRAARMVWPDGALKLSPAKTTQADDGELRLSPADQQAILEIPVKRGDYPLPSGKALVRVIPSEIWNANRTEIVRTIG